MTTANFIDFSQTELRNIVQDHNLHLMIKNYSKLTKSELVKLIETILFIDSNNRIKIMPKILSKYNEYFKDITPGYIIVKRKFKKAPKEQPKQKLPAIPIIPKEYSEEIEKHKKNVEKLTKPTKPVPKMLENNEIEIKLTLEQIAKAIKSVKRQKPALEDRMLSILNRMADGQTKFKSFNEGTIKEMISYL
jgi:hypothetical protein